MTRVCGVVWCALGAAGEEELSGSGREPPHWTCIIACAGTHTAHARTHMHSVKRREADQIFREMTAKGLPVDYVVYKDEVRACGMWNVTWVLYVHLKRGACLQV